MAPKLKRPEFNPDKPAEEESWKPAWTDPAVDEDHELPTEESKHPMPTPMPAD
jgi:hypothetical protein